MTVSAPVHVRFRWEGAKAGGVQLDGYRHLGWVPSRKFPAPQLVSATCQLGKLSTMGVPLGWGGNCIAYILCSGLNRSQQQALPSISPLFLPPKSRAREILDTVERGRLGLEDSDTHFPEKLSWKISTGS